MTSVPLSPRVGDLVARLTDPHHFYTVVKTTGNSAYLGDGDGNHIQVDDFRTIALAFPIRPGDQVYSRVHGETGLVVKIEPYQRPSVTLELSSGGKMEVQINQVYRVPVGTSLSISVLNSVGVTEALHDQTTYYGSKSFDLDQLSILITDKERQTLSAALTSWRTSKLRSNDVSTDRELDALLRKLST